MVSLQLTKQLQEELEHFPLIPNTLKPIVHTDEDCRILVHLAIDNFITNYRLEELVNILERVCAKKSVQSDFAVLREQRLLLNMLSSAYKLFSNEHKPPQSLWWATKYIGYVKDNLFAEQVVQLAPLLSKALDLLNDQRISICSFPSFISVKEFQIYYAQQLDAINTLTRDDPFLLKEFHQIRKALRDIKYIYEIAAYGKQFEGIEEPFKYMHKLSQVLGFFKDTAFQAADSTDSDGCVTIRLPTQMQAIIAKTVDHLRVKP